MTTDFRAELQRLVKAYDEHGGKWPDHHEQALFQAVQDARTALAQPEPVVLTRPDCFNFALDFLGGTEEVEVRNYIERLESAARAAQPEPVAPTLVYRYSPVTVAECGGPCEQGPQYCDCGQIKGKPMSPDFRALCTELVDIATAHCNPDDSAVGHCAAVLTRARTELAKPEPVAPTDEELEDLAEVMNVSGNPVPAMRRALELWGTPIIQPVPVSERLPEVGDWVWHCYVGVRFWEHGRYNGRQFFIGDGPESQPATHWRPANALPTPEATNG